MKKILITGANSYIGTSFQKYLTENFPDDYSIDTVDMIDGSWRDKSFAEYDSIFHVAGIAHQKETKENVYQYYKVNRDLVIETAQKAKHEGVGQFVFLSSMSVYGMDVGIITRDTVPNPVSNYGKSKLQAEKAINKLADDNFKICILRPPMVYGEGCKGNFVKIKKIVEKFPIFPYVKNKRSMIYIDNLCSFVKRCIEGDSSGLFLPQNEEYMSTVELVKGIGEALGKRVHLEYVIGALVSVLRIFHPTLRKAFGSLIYVTDEAPHYCVVSKKESIKKSV